MLSTLLLGILSCGEAETAELSRSEPLLSAQEQDPFRPPGAIACLGSNRFRHADLITSLGYSPDGGMLISASQEGTIRGWDPESGIVRLRYPRSKGGVLSIAFSPRGTLIASLGRTKTIDVWDASKGTLRRQLNGAGLWVLSAAFSPDGTRLATGNSDGTLELWEIETGKLIHTLKGHEWAVTAVCFSRNGERLISGSVDRTIRLWDVEGGRALRSLAGHTGCVTALSCSPDGTLLASASGDCEYPDSSVAGREVISHETGDRSIRLWDLRTESALTAIPDAGPGHSSIAFSPDGRSLAYGGAALRVWDVALRKERMSFKGPGREICSLAFSPDSKRLAGAFSSVNIWDLASGRELTQPFGHRFSVNGMAFLPDGQSVVSAGFERDIRLWSSRSGRQVALLEGPASEIVALAVSPDGKTLATSSADRPVGFWDLERREALRSWRGGARPKSMSYSSRDGSLALSGQIGALVILDPSTSQTIRLEDDKTALCLSASFSGDGNRVLACFSGGSLCLWDWPSRRLLLRINGPLDAEECALSGDGLAIAVGGKSGKTLLFDGTSGEAVGTLDGRHPCFSPDGTWIATGEESIHLWELSTGGEVLAFDADSGSATCVAFSPDGTAVASGHENGLAFLWNPNPLLKKDPMMAEPIPGLLQRLKADESRASYKALWALVERGDESLPLLKAELSVMPAELESAAESIGMLSHDDAAVRERAARQIEASDSESAVRKALKSNPSDDVGMRLKQILVRMRSPFTKSPAVRYRCRIIQVLSHLDSPQARQLLQELSQRSESKYAALANAALAGRKASSYKNRK